VLTVVFHATIGVGTGYDVYMCVRVCVAIRVDVVTCCHICACCCVGIVVVICVDIAIVVVVGMAVVVCVDGCVSCYHWCWYWL